MTDQALDRIRRLVLGLALLVIVVLLLRELADVALLVFAAILIADVLHGGAERLGRRLRLPTGAALLLILVAGIATLGCAIWFRGPVISTEIVGLAGQVSAEAGRLRQALADAPWAQHAIARVQAYLAGGHVAGMVSGIATGTLGVLGSFVVMVAAALYFAASPGLYVRGALMLLPIDRRPRGREILLALGHTLRWWFVGQAVDMLAVGTLTTIGLELLGIPLAFTLGLIAALFNFVPYIGALAGAVPAVLVGLGVGPRAALSVAILFVLVQSLEGYVIAPLIQRRTVELPPVLTIFSQTVLGTLFGPLGLILATPLTAAGMVLVRMIYIEDVLGDHATEPEPHRR